MTVQELIKVLEGYHPYMEVSVTNSGEVNLLQYLKMQPGVDSNGFYFPDTVTLVGSEG